MCALCLYREAFEHVMGLKQSSGNTGRKKGKRHAI